MTMAGERSRFSKESVVRGHHVYKHVWTPEIGEELSVKKEPGNLHDDFAVSVVFQAELTSTAAHSARYAPGDYSRTGIRYCTRLVTLALKRDSASKRSGGYSRQYGTSLCFSNVKSTPEVPLTFNKVEKTKLENFDFVHLSSFFFHRHSPKSIRSLRILNIPNGCLANLLHSYLF